MSNIRHTTYKRLDSKISREGYYDFALSVNDHITPCDMFEFNSYNHTCLVSWFDFDKIFTYNGSEKTSANIDKIYSIRSWVGTVIPEDGIVVDNFGLTAMDNGALPYKFIPRDTCLPDEDNDFVEKFTNSKEIIDDFKKKQFFMRKVDSVYSNHTFDIDIEKDPTKDYVGYYSVLRGGFFQGYYKLDGYDYQTLPTRFENGFSLSVWLNKDDSVLSGNEKLVNEKYPNNKGFFLYFGSRAENKFYKEFKGNNTQCPDLNKEFFTEKKENQIKITTTEGDVSIIDKPKLKRVIENQFLIYGRGKGLKDGLGKFSPMDFEFKHDIGVEVDLMKKPIGLPANPFLIYGRGKGKGCCERIVSEPQKTACEVERDAIEAPEPPIDPNKDIIDNALGFRITDDGRLEYRYITLNEDKEIVVIEDSTNEDLLVDGEWTNILIRWLPDYYIDSECDNKPRIGKLMIYVNCYLKYVFDNFPEFIGKRLNEIKEKQVGVPYNISLGGGSLGLMESTTLDGPDPSDFELTIEKNFAGTFIGKISQFKIYDCDLTWSHIKQICYEDYNRYHADGFLIQETTPEEFYILLESFGKIKL